MENKKYLDNFVDVIIDRPIGSKHSKFHNSIYPINYGFVPNTISGDGKELDCYILGVYTPIKKFKGKCIAIIHRLNDNDDKLIIVPENKNFTNEQIEVLVEFQEQYFKHEIIRNEPEFNSLIPEFSVTDINISKKFYINLGFRIVYERPENKFCFLQLENNQIMLEECNDNWNIGKMEYPFGNGINISMSVKDVDTMYKTIKNKEIKLFIDLETHEYKVNETIYQDKEFLLQDPDGYLLRFNN